MTLALLSCSSSETARSSRCGSRLPRPSNGGGRLALVEASLDGVESLTERELRVATLAADGQTNRDIAQALYVTPKTVEVHLTNAYRKLNIASRRELPAALTPA